MGWLELSIWSLKVWKLWEPVKIPKAWLKALSDKQRINEATDCRVITVIVYIDFYALLIHQTLFILVLGLKDMTTFLNIKKFKKILVLQLAKMLTIEVFPLPFNLKYRYM